MEKYYCKDIEGNAYQVIKWRENWNKYENGIACYASIVKPLTKGYTHTEIIPITEYFEIINGKEKYLPPYRVDFKIKGI